MTSLQKVLIVIPAYNEEATISDVLSEFATKPEFDVLVVDDGSTDATREVVKQFNFANILPLQINIGAWPAIQGGFRYAMRKGYDLVITMDGDGQHHVGEIQKLLDRQQNHPEEEVIVGACTIRGSRLRRLAWAYFRKIAGLGTQDITSGFRLYNKRAIKLLVQRPVAFLDFQDVGVLLLLKKAGFIVSEVEVNMSARKSGKSHIYYSWFAVAYYMLITTLLSIAKGRVLGVRVPQIGQNNNSKGSF